MTRREITEADIAEAFQAMMDQGFSYRGIKNILDREFRLNLIQSYMAEGMSKEEAEEYANELTP